MNHQPDCAWTLATCEYKETHHYCPHPEHVCTCTREPSEPPADVKEEAMAILTQWFNSKEAEGAVLPDVPCISLRNRIAAALTARSSDRASVIRECAAVAQLYLVPGLDETQSAPGTITGQHLTAKNIERDILALLSTPADKQKEDAL